MPVRALAAGAHLPARAGGSPRWWQGRHSPAGAEAAAVEPAARPFQPGPGQQVVVFSPAPIPFLRPSRTCRSSRRSSCVSSIHCVSRANCAAAPRAPLRPSACRPPPGFAPTGAPRSAPRPSDGRLRWRRLRQRRPPPDGDAPLIHLANLAEHIGEAGLGFRIQRRESGLRARANRALHPAQHVIIGVRQALPSWPPHTIRPACTPSTPARPVRCRCPRKMRPPGRPPSPVQHGAPDGSIISSSAKIRCRQRKGAVLQQLC